MMVCSPVRGDNLRTQAHELSPIQVDNHGMIILCTYISTDLARYEIFCAKVSKLLDLSCFSYILMTLLKICNSSIRLFC